MIRLFVVFLCALAPLISFAKNTLPTEIDMFVGEARVIPTDAARIAIGNGGVIAVTNIENRQLLVIGNKAGTSTLHVWFKDKTEHIATVTVRDASMKSKLDDINKLLTSVDNVSARIAGNKIVLEGSMVSDANQERVRAIAEIYKDVVLNFVGKVGWEKMIYLDFKVLELTAKGSSELGIRWDSSVNGPAAGVVADFAGNSLYRHIPNPEKSGVEMSAGFPLKVWPPKGFLSLATLITSRINLLVQNGDATVLASPSLTTRSGGTAKFIAGGEIPLPVQGANGQVTVEFKEYGILATVTPVVDSAGVIFAKVEVEVSSLDPSVTVLGIPGILKRKSSTEFNAKDGETMVLNGLYSYQASKDAQKVPLLGNLPLLGGLFRNKGSSDQTREVAIVITPRLGAASPPASLTPADVNGERLRQFERQMRDNVPQQAPVAPLTIAD